MIPVLVSQSPRDWMTLGVPPSSMVIITQFAKMSLVVLKKAHPGKISGCGFRVTRRKGSALAITDLTQENKKGYTHS